MSDYKGRPLIEVLFEDEPAEVPTFAKRRRYGRRANGQRGRTVSIYLIPPEQEAALKNGDTVQNGLRNVLRLAGVLRSDRRGDRLPRTGGWGKTFNLYLTPDDQEIALRHGATVQEGLRRLLGRAAETC
jgi:hypothetical protein